jgi:hypothetical protein
MRFKLFVSLLALGLIASASIVARAQDEDEAVRGSFITSRPKSTTSSVNSTSATITAGASQVAGNSATGNSGNSGRSNRSRNSSGRASGSARVNVNTPSGNVSGSVKGNASVNTNSSGNSYVPSAIGLGYTIYMRDSSGNAVRVDPSQEFHAGDRIRLSLETNTDGYLYIFHTENDGTPEMLYPDVHLEKGSNHVQAHVPYEIPWNEPGVENWFKFDANPATERLYIVLTRQPLPSVPTGQALVDYCNQNRCPWQPRVESWPQLKMSGQAKVAVVKSSSYGQKQTAAEREATTRGLGLDQSAPEPSVIRMSATSDAPILITTVDLIHK